jgi:hypothetical protein
MRSQGRYETAARETGEFKDVKSRSKRKFKRKKNLKGKGEVIIS